MIPRFIAAPRSVADALPSNWRRLDLGSWVVAASSAPRTTDCSSLWLGELHSFAGGPVGDVTLDVAADRLRRGLMPDGIWGNYAVLWHEADWLHVYRDPGGGVPVYCRADRDVPLIGSDPEQLCASGLLGLAIDWPGVMHRLFYPQLHVTRTGWSGVAECLPGQAMRVGRTIEPRTLWSPWQFTSRTASTEAPVDVRRSVLGVIKAMGRDRSEILLELSGGLDSSILAAGLGLAGADWSAVNLVTPAKDGDEREHARAVATRWSVPLTEIALDPGLVDLLAPPARRTPVASGLGMIAAVDKVYRQFASNPATLMSGTGGDNVFCSLRSAAPIVDAARSGRLATAAQAARDLADLTGTSWWAAIGAAIRYQRLDSREPDRWRGASALLRVDATPPFASHPWLEAPPGRLAGTRAHIILLLRAHSVRQGIERAWTTDMLFPFLAQPVIETCLSIPSWQWIGGGRDRSVARDAFDDVLPPQVNARRIKGRLESWLMPAFARQRSAIRDLILDGRLIRHGIVDRSAVIHATRSEASVDDASFAALMMLVDTEFWLDQSSGAPRVGHRPPSGGTPRIGGID